MVTVQEVAVRDSELGMGFLPSALARGHPRGLCRDLTSQTACNHLATGTRAVPKGHCTTSNRSKYSRVLFVFVFLLHLTIQSYTVNTKEHPQCLLSQ